LSNYTKSTNFATKDNLSSGNPLKIVKGTDIDTEFNDIATAIATKADLASPTFTGTPTLPTGTVATTQSAGNNTTAIATTAFVQAAIALLYPVGSIYTNATSSTNPATLLGFGTWTAFGAGRVPVGFDSTNALFDSAEETGGSADSLTISHTHTATSTDSGHSHTLAFSAGSTMTGLGSTGASGWQGANTGVNYITVSATNSSTANITTTVASAGSSGTNANYQPYITVYMWKRTA
jgi:hypothetical protein